MSVSLIICRPFVFPFVSLFFPLSCYVLSVCLSVCRAMFCQSVFPFVVLCFVNLSFRLSGYVLSVCLSVCRAMFCQSVFPFVGLYFVSLSFRLSGYLLSVCLSVCRAMFRYTIIMTLHSHCSGVLAGICVIAVFASPCRPSQSLPTHPADDRAKLAEHLHATHLRVYRHLSQHNIFMQPTSRVYRHVIQQNIFMQPTSESTDM